MNRWDNSGEIQYKSNFLVTCGTVAESDLVRKASLFEQRSKPGKLGQRVNVQNELNSNNERTINNLMIRSSKIKNLT